MDVLKLENRHTGEVLRMHRLRDASGQIVLMIEGSLPPRMSGPPPHIHFHQREQGYVKASTMGARVGNEKIVLRTGESAVFPAGVVHTWWNAGEELLELTGQLRRSIWTATSRLCLPFSMQARPVGRRSST
jgi:uncharacterized cupin superfamily protein